MKKGFASLMMAMAFCATCLISVLQAQESTNYKLKEYTFNNGGDPRNGTVLTSTNYKVSLDSIGDTIADGSMSSASYGINSGFDTWYLPPDEVLNLRFLSDKTTLTWSPEGSVGHYNLYRDLLSNLDPGYGNCQETLIQDEQATDASTPSAGQGYFYLVTAVNRIYEEGTMGYKSSGGERPNSSPCP
ncbi:MAG: hypothetical protein AB1756_04100 [Acidobacteriota bacterium]